MFLMICFQDFSILCWNVRGVVSTAGRRHTRELVKKHQPSMIMLMETHCVFDKAKRFWHGQGYEAAAVSEAQGHSGGIWILVERGRNFTVSEVDYFHQMVTVSVKKASHEWWCTVVYASPVPAARELLWDHICSMRSRIQGPWLLMGDYNEILLPSEVRGGPFVTNRSQNFASVLDNCGLLDLGSSGLFFTWSRKANGEPTISKRLDRALADYTW